MSRRPGFLLAAITVTIVCVAAGRGLAQRQSGAPEAETPTAETLLPWAFPVAPPGATREDDGKPHAVPGSTMPALMQAQIHDPYAPPDWFPDEHPPMPEVVSHGRRPVLRACAQCHLPNGLGHPPASGLAGLPAGYLIQQMYDFKKNKRKHFVLMNAIAAAATETEVKESAEYYASLPPRPWVSIIEASTVPKTFVGVGGMRLVSKEGGVEPIGQRIIEVPEDAVQIELRNSHSGLVAYVPVGSVKKGKVLATTGGRGKTIRCSICHGPDLRGLANVPSIAGRSPIYTLRQLYMIQTGDRTGIWAELMKDTVAKLTLEDMISLAAYTSSLNP